MFAPTSVFQLPAAQVPMHLDPCPEYIGLWHGLSVWFSLHSNWHRSAVSPFDRLTCFPSVLVDCPGCGNLTPTSAPSTRGCRSGPTPLPSLFPSLPSSHRVSRIYIFLSSYQGLLPELSWFSARAFASEMHSWCICTPRPSILLPSCPPQVLSFKLRLAACWWVMK